MKVIYNEGQFNSESEAIHNAPVRFLNAKDQMCLNNDEMIFMVIKDTNGNAFEYAIEVSKLNDAIKPIASLIIERSSEIKDNISKIHISKNVIKK